MPIDERTEWLEADGLGGFASAMTSGVRTRRYHALLLTAMTPPTGRVVLVNGFDADRQGAAVTFRPYDGFPEVTALSNGEYRHAPDWYRQFLYTAERERGLDDTEDLASP